MGIPGYSAWFHQQNAGCYAPLSNTPIDHLYIDANSIIHNAMRSARSWEHFHKAMHVRLNSVLETTAPKKTVMIAVDGPAPLAKLLTQRLRRKSDRDSAAVKSLKRKARGGGGRPQHGGSNPGSEDEDASALTGNAITPGTHLMLDLSLSLVSWACTKLTSAKWGHLQIEVSDSTVKGEGEVKILGRIARPWHPVLSTDTHAILGDDADLVLMALSCRNPRLVVINGALNDGHMARDMQVFCVRLLHERWLATLLPQQRVALGKSDEELLRSLKCDLVLLSVVSKGNDYVPGLRGVSLETASGCSGVWDTYKKLWRSAGGGGGGGASPGRGGGAGAQDPSIVRFNGSGRPLLCLVALASLLEMCAEKRSPMRIGDAAAEEAAAALDEPHKKPPSSNDYLRGLIWMMDMYLQGECPDYRFYYDGDAPSAQQLVAFCKEMAGQRGSSLLSYLDYHPLPPGSENPLLPFATAMALLPAKCTHLLPAAVRPLMEDRASPIQDIYYQCPTCKALKKEESEASRRVGLTRLKVDALVSHIDGAVRSGDAGHQQELQLKLEEAEAELRKDKEANRRAVVAVRRHVTQDHKYEPFPVERLVDVASQVPASAFKPAELPLTSFGRASVLMRAPAAQQQAARSGGVQYGFVGGRQYYSSSSSGTASFRAPEAPFSGSRTYHGGAALARYAVVEPDLAAVGGTAVGGPPLAVVLQPDPRQLVVEYMSQPRVSEGGEQMGGERGGKQIAGQGRLGGRGGAAGRGGRGPALHGRGVAGGSAAPQPPRRQAWEAAVAAPVAAAGASGMDVDGGVPGVPSAMVQAVQAMQAVQMAAAVQAPMAAAAAVAASAAAGHAGGGGLHGDGHGRGRSSPGGRGGRGGSFPRGGRGQGKAVEGGGRGGRDGGSGGRGGRGGGGRGGGAQAGPSTSSGAGNGNGTTAAPQAVSDGSAAGSSAAGFVPRPASASVGGGGGGPAPPMPSGRLLSAAVHQAGFAQHHQHQHHQHQHQQWQHQQRQDGGQGYCGGGGWDGMAAPGPGSSGGRVMQGQQQQHGQGQGQQNWQQQQQQQQWGQQYGNRHAPSASRQG